MSYKNLEIWQLARPLVIDIHKMTLKIGNFGEKVKSISPSSGKK